MDYKRNYMSWLKNKEISENEHEELKNLDDKDIKEFFGKNIEFGTAGLRGIMRLGTNSINLYTIRLAAKGLSMTLNCGDSVVIAYDTRNNSRDYAFESARVLAADGKKVYLFDEYSPVPLLSYAIRKLNADAGIAITASHNTKEYNGFKAYDNFGCQITEELATQISNNMRSVDNIFDIKVSKRGNNNIMALGRQLYDCFISDVLGCSVYSDVQAKEKLSIVYTPIHGSGLFFVKEALIRDGFKGIEYVDEQCDYNGEFYTVKKPNPEDKSALKMAGEKACDINADLIIGTDPDCDRVGVAIQNNGKVIYFSGNQIGALLVDFLVHKRECKGKTLITTVVTGDLGSDIGKKKGLNVIKTLTGFKYIGSVINEMNSNDFFMGYEESYGYLVGSHARDKDGVSAALVICEMTAYYKAHGMTLADRLKEIYDEYGYYLDAQDSFIYEGVDAVECMEEVVNRIRYNYESILYDFDIREMQDFSNGFDSFPSANLLKIILGNGSWIAIRPSGTEPKVKCYYCIKNRNKESAEKMYMNLRSVISNIF